MKRQTGIWIDKEKAVLITLSNGNHTIKNINSGITTKERNGGEGKDSGRFGNQFLNSEKKRDSKLNQQLQNFLKEVISTTKESDSMVIFGPAETKGELEKMIRSNNEMAKMLLDVKTADKMTENQMIAWLREYYN